MNFTDGNGEEIDKNPPYKSLQAVIDFLWAALICYFDGLL